MKIVSIHVGRVQSIPEQGSGEWWDRRWETGFIKESVVGPVALGPEGLEGDEQADRVNHGGVDKAVCVYPATHYADWRLTLGMPDLAWGAFGENLTVEGLSEAGVCIGDVIAAGNGVVQISQPRQPCWKLARRWRVKDLAAQVERTGKTGWYFRVLKAGVIESGQSLALCERPHPDWSVALANEVMHHCKTDRDAAEALAGCEALSASWRESLSRRAASLRE